jgi:cbb3-type cytochrome oxidase maturation protein
MSVIIILLVSSISVALVFLIAFIWSVKNKQYDDEFSPPVRILFDDAPAADVKHPPLNKDSNYHPETDTYAS